MKKDYLLTFLAEFIAMALGILVFKIAAMKFGELGFSEYAVARRTISFLLLPLLLGLGISIPRYIALAGSSSSGRVTDAYLMGGLLVDGLVLAVGFALLVGLRRAAAFLFFGDPQYESLVLPVGVCLAGMCLHILAYGDRRGRLRMTEANGLQLINVGIVPLLVFAIPGLSLPALLATTGLAWLAVSGVALAAILRRFRRPDWGDVWPKIRDLMRYGLPRVPGELALTGLLALPVFFTAHFHNVVQAGQLAFAISLLSMIGSLFSPLGLLLLPTVSDMTARRTLSAFKPTLRKILLGSSALCLVITGFAEWLTPPFIRIFLGPEFRETIGIVRVILLGALPYVVYLVLRNVLDAVDVRPLNAVNLTVSLGLFCVLFWIGPGYSAPIGLVIALCVLGSLSLWQAQRTFQKLKPIDRPHAGI